MTAEVAIMNCSGVALAADSAVTVGSQKIYNSAVKLFALSKVAPVAVMIYGNAALSRIPWEVVIKEYRRNLKAKVFPKLNDYGDDLVAFISNSPLLFDKETEQAWIRERVVGLFSGIFTTAGKKIEAAIEASKGAGIAEQQIKDLYVQTIEEQLDAAKTWDDLKPSKPVVTRIRTTCSAIADDAGPQIFGAFYPSLSKKLIATAVQFLRRSYFPGPSSGVVIAGYGEQEIFPSVRTLEFDGAIAGFPRFREDKARTQRINANSHSASIIAYAQEDMVATFMEGINPSVKRFLSSSIEAIFQAFPEYLMNSLGINDAAVKTSLDSICSTMVQRLSSSAEKYRFDEHVMPVLSMVNALPKDELAAMAESLVNLTAFKRRVTGALETVGGPIDVCVISKGDGLVWVKRKHYFPPELNLLFQRNYMRDLA